MEMLANKSLIMGFGHRVYTVSDPRNEVIKGWAERLGKMRFLACCAKLIR